MELKTKYIVIFVTLFVLCIGLYMLGRLLKRRLDIQHPYYPFLMTGFEYGMFGSAYGLEHIGYIAIINNVLTLYAVVSITIFTVFFIINPVL